LVPDCFHGKSFDSGLFLQQIFLVPDYLQLIFWFQIAFTVDLLIPACFHGKSFWFQIVSTADLFDSRLLPADLLIPDCFPFDLSFRILPVKIDIEVILQDPLWPDKKNEKSVKYFK